MNDCTLIAYTPRQSSHRFLPRYFMTRSRRRQYRSRAALEHQNRGEDDAREAGGEVAGRRFAWSTAVTIASIAITTRRDAPFRVPLSRRATRRSAARRRGFSGPRGASVGPRQWGREGGARRLHGHSARDIEARESGSGVTQSERRSDTEDGRGREVNASAVGRPPSLPRPRTASIQWK